MKETTIDKGGGDDELNGDFISGLDGNDVIVGGNDILYGDSGNESGGLISGAVIRGKFISGDSGRCGDRRR